MDYNKRCSSSTIGNGRPKLNKFIKPKDTRKVAVQQLFWKLKDYLTEYFGFDWTEYERASGRFREPVHIYTAICRIYLNATYKKIAIHLHRDKDDMYRLMKKVIQRYEKDEYFKKDVDVIYYRVAYERDNNDSI